MKMLSAMFYLTLMSKWKNNKKDLALISARSFLFEVSSIIPCCLLIALKIYFRRVLTVAGFFASELLFAAGADFFTWLLLRFAVLVTVADDPELPDVLLTVVDVPELPADFVL
jgi:hypothetical protein